MPSAQQTAMCFCVSAACRSPLEATNHRLFCFLSGENGMESPRYFINGAPTCCAHCKQPFPVVTGRIEAWRSSMGGYFCNEFCAGDDEEAAFQTYRTSLAVAGHSSGDGH